MNRRALGRPLLSLILLAALVLGAVVARVLAVAPMVPAGQALAVVLGEPVPGISFIVMDDRLPTAVVAILAGTAFGLSGTIFQTLLRNPLASPDVIGVALGAAARMRHHYAWTWLLALGYLGAVLLHAAWNAVATLAHGLGDLVVLVVFVNWLPLLVWAVVVVLLRRHEISILARRLWEYVPTGWIVPQEITMLTSMEGRRAAVAWAAQGGPRVKKAMKRFQRAAVALAYARQDLHTGSVGVRARRDEQVLLATMGRARARFRTAMGV